MNIFSVDGPLFKFMRTLLDVLKINFLWLLCSLPIITIGPATVAAFSVMLKMIDESEGYVGRQFFKAFKANFKNGLPLGIMFLVAIYALYLDVQLVMTGLHPFMFLAVLLIAIYIFLSIFTYVFALSARYENTFMNTVKNAHSIFLQHFLKTLAIIAVVAVEIIVLTYNTTMIFFLIILGPGCIILTISGMSLPIFREIERDGGVMVKETTNTDAVFEDHPDTDNISQKAHMNFNRKNK